MSAPLDLAAGRPPYVDGGARYDRLRLAAGPPARAAPRARALATHPNARDQRALTRTLDSPGRRLAADRRPSALRFLYGPRDYRVRR